jgi:hypothetical protein
MSPGSPDASDELQVIPRRPSGGPPPPSKPPASERPSEAPADPARQKRLARVVAVALGLCAFILVAAGVARALRPRDSASAANPAASASAAASAAAPVAPPQPSASETPAAIAPAPAPTTGTVVFDRPATPGKIWIDGKKIAARSVDVPCGSHKIKIGAGKTKPVIVTCGAELHLTR